MASLAKYQAELESLKSKVAKNKALASIKTKSGRIQHTAIASGTAFIVGAADSKNTNPLPDIFGLDKKLVWGVIVHGLATSIKGKWAESMAAVGDGLLTSYAYTEGAGKGYTIQGQPGAGYEYAAVGADKNYVEDDDIEV